ncbi:MAG: DUF6444 domain-containing protein [Christensenellales bacterium]
MEEKVRKLENEISRLKSNQDKDSHNSSLPPSTDRKPKAANEYNGRTKTGKKSGGQPGHKGTTRRMEQMKQALACIGVEPEIEDVGGYYSAYTRLAQYFSPFEYRQYGRQQGQLPALTCFNETQDAAVHLRTIQRAKASGHFLAILAFAQVTFT